MATVQKSNQESKSLVTLIVVALMAMAIGFGLFWALQKPQSESVLVDDKSYLQFADDTSEAPMTEVVQQEEIPAVTAVEEPLTNTVKTNRVKANLSFGFK